MKKSLLILSVTLMFLIFPKFSNAQIIEAMEGAASGIGNIIGDANAVEVVEVFVDVLWYPTYGLFIGFEGEPLPSAVDFARYPYEYSDVGMYMPFGEGGYRARGQFLGHYQSNGDVFQGAYFQLKYSPWQFLAFDVNHLQLFEEVENPENQSDRLGITNFNVHYNRIRHRIFHAWWGLGATKFRTEDVDYISANFALGTTIFIKAPLSLHAEITTAYPNGALMTQSQVRAQIHVERYMFYGGYQGLRVGDVFEPSWTIGLGVHF